MTTTTVDQDVIQEIIDSVWGTVLGLFIEPLPPPGPNDTPPHLSVCVHITGAWNGVVLFWPSEQFAVKAAAILFAIPEEIVSGADIQDGMAELGNIIAGNLKSVLPGPSKLSLPTVTRGQRHEVFVRRTHEVAHLEFDCEGERQSVQLLERTVPEEELSADEQSES